jgi:hypothetical protein
MDVVVVLLEEYVNQWFNDWLPDEHTLILITFATFLERENQISLSLARRGVGQASPLMSERGVGGQAAPAPRLLGEVGIRLQLFVSLAKRGISSAFRWRDGGSAPARRFASETGSQPRISLATRGISSSLFLLAKRGISSAFRWRLQLLVSLAKRGVDSAFRWRNKQYAPAPRFLCEMGSRLQLRLSVASRGVGSSFSFR